MARLVRYTQAVVIGSNRRRLEARYGSECSQARQFQDECQCGAASTPAHFPRFLQALTLDADGVVAGRPTSARVIKTIEQAMLGVPS